VLSIARQSSLACSFGGRLEINSVLPMTVRYVFWRWAVVSVCSNTFSPLVVTSGHLFDTLGILSGQVGGFRAVSLEVVPFPRFAATPVDEFPAAHPNRLINRPAAAPRR